MSFHYEYFRKHPQVYVWKVNYSNVVNFLIGVDHMMRGGAFIGFEEWLEPRTGGWREYGWPGMVLILAFPGFDGPPPPEHYGKDETRDKHAIDALFRCLDAYYLERDAYAPAGLRHIFLRHQMWKESKGRNDFAAEQNWWELEPKIVPRFSFPKGKLDP